jgi:prophage regulatory protein
MQSDDLEARLWLDPGQRTLGQLLQDRTAAALEIRRLRLELASLEAARRVVPPPPRLSRDEAEVLLSRPAMLRLSEVCRLIGMSRSAIYRRIKEETFPAPLRVGDRSVRWASDVIDAWRDSLRPSMSAGKNG